MKLYGRKLFIFFINISLQQGYAFEPALCQLETFGEVMSDSKPKYWAQRMIRPKDESLFLTRAEIERPVIFAINELGAIDFGSPELSSLYWRGEFKKQNNNEYMKGYNDHVTGSLSIISSSGQVGILPSLNSKVWHFQEYAFEKAFKQILEYNKTAADNKKIRVVSSNASISLFLRPEVENILKVIEARGDFTILVPGGNASGSYSNEDLVAVEKLKKYKSVMLIGAISSNYQSAWISTNSHQNFSLAAPAEGGKGVYGQASHKGRFASNDEFSGTCGAQALSSGALAVIQKVNPRVNARIGRAIIKATALSNQTSTDIGIGSPNVPLAALVAREFDFSNYQSFKEENLINLIESWIDEYLLKNLLSFSNDAWEVISSRQISCSDRNAFTYKGISNDTLRASKNCSEYAKNADCLLNQFFLSDGNSFYKSELCEMYIDQNLGWGIKNYCSPQVILDSLGEDEFVNDMRLYNLIANKGEDLFGSKEELQRVLLKIINKIKKIPKNEINEYKVVFKRDILGNNKISFLFPNIASQLK